MPYLCNPNFDIPQSGKLKQIIYYAQGLKVYGELPYLLKRRLRANFFSNDHHNGEFRLVAPAIEPNYSVIPYKQDSVKVKALLDWLFLDAGFEWAIASPQEFNNEIYQSTAFSTRLPSTWVPAANTQGWRDGFHQSMQGFKQSEIRTLLMGQADVG